MKTAFSKQFNIKKYFGWITGRRLLIAGLFSIFLTASLYHYLRLLPPPLPQNQTTITFYDYQGEPFLEQTFPQRHHWAGLEDISPYVIEGFIATEDRRFPYHFGFDLPRIAQSAWGNLTGQRLQGASTITQQYARNIFQSFEQTWARKAREAFYAARLEIHLDKDEIMEGYLNSINFGHGNIGISDAAFFYFGRPASELALAEAALLVGIPRGPSLYSPLINLPRSLARQGTVLGAMLREGFITQAQHDEALDFPLEIVGTRPPHDFEASYFVDGVLSELDQLLEGTAMNRDELHIFTTFNPGIQDHVNDAINQTVTDWEVQTAVIVLEPQTGNVLALAGGNDYRTTQFNRALYSQRHPGSLLKPFLAYAALDFGFNPSSTFLSQPTNFLFNNGDDLYAPGNFMNQYAFDSISLANALAVSDNIYFVKTHLFLGMPILAEIANLLGIRNPIPILPSAALGAAEVNIMDMAEAYSVFANEGRAVNHQFIRQVQGADGKVLFTRYQPEPQQLLDPTRTFLVNEMLTGMFEPRNNNHLAATGLSIIPQLTNRYAGKSGSTLNDSWMIGFTPDISVTVWTGFDEGRHLNGTSINRYAKNIWAHVIENSLQGSATWFTPPADVTPLLVNANTGHLAPTQDCGPRVALYFENHNLPRQSCPLLEQPAPPQNPLTFKYDDE